MDDLVTETRTIISGPVGPKWFARFKTVPQLRQVQPASKERRRGTGKGKKKKREKKGRKRHPFRWRVAVVYEYSSRNVCYILYSLHMSFTYE